MADNPPIQAETTPSKAYTAQLSAGQQLHLQNNDHITTLTLTTTGPGQQQQSSSTLSTGAWTSAPQLFQIGDGHSDGYSVVVTNRENKYYFQVQSSQIQSSRDLPNQAVADALKTSRSLPMEPAAAQSQNAMPSMQPMAPMQPMQPMTPMTMGNMSMSPLSPSGPMSMTMGNMSLSTAETGQAEPSAEDTAAKVKRFCSQCGGAITASDRFCAYCGHQLNQ